MTGRRWRRLAAGYGAFLAGAIGGGIAPDRACVLARMAARFAVRAQYGGRRYLLLDVGEGREEACTWRELANANGDDPDFARILDTLPAGAAIGLGGGAFPAYELRRTR